MTCRSCGGDNVVDFGLCPHCDEVWQDVIDDEAALEYAEPDDF